MGCFCGGAVGAEGMDGGLKGRVRERGVQWCERERRGVGGWLAGEDKRRGWRGESGMAWCEGCWEWLGFVGEVGHGYQHLCMYYVYGMDEQMTSWTCVWITCICLIKDKCVIIIHVHIGRVPATNFSTTERGGIVLSRERFLCYRKKTTQAVKATPHIYEGKGATLVLSTVKLLHREKERENQWGSEGCRLGLKPAPDGS
jgi:hypothetical protein